MKHTEDHKYLADEQHRGRSRQASIDVVALKQFTAETQHYQRCNSGMTDCNAKACYNRITPELLLLLYYKAGYPKEVVELMYKALTMLEYAMTRAMGILKKKSTSNLNILLFGIGQGATDIPPEWALHMNMITTLYSEKTKGSTMRNPSGTITVPRD
eukprot:7381881-Ditylum_brightwellii.AAC.1